jgi:molybdenum cofactor cytidylyltransferase
MTAVILAAGSSRRFGGKKLLAEISGKPMLLNVVDLVMSIGFKEVLLVYQDEEVKKVIGDRDIRCIYNARAEEGQSTSVICGVLHADQDTEGYMFFTGDQPFIDRGTVENVIQAFKAGKGSIVVPKYSGHKGNPVIFSSCWKDRLLSLSGDVGGREIIQENKEKVFFVEVPDIKKGLDIDTREQYDSIKELNLNV